MPIFEQTYKPWVSRHGGGGRWRAVAAQELRVARSSPIYRRVLLLSLLPFLICLFILVVTDLMTTNPSALFRTMVRQVQFTNVDARFFKIYLGLVTPFVYLFCLLIGGGSICNDYRHNLLEVYFAKPLSRFEYFLGKLAAVCYVPLGLTIVGSMTLYLLHMLLAPASASDFLAENLWVAPMCVAYSLIIVVPSALFVMACSALSKSTGWASVVVCALVFMNSASAGAAAGILRSRNLVCLSYIRSMIHLGDLLFGGHTRITVTWETIVAGVALLSVVCAIIVLRRIRAVDIAS